jgi:hypothetical protein
MELKQIALKLIVLKGEIEDLNNALRKHRHLETVPARRALVGAAADATGDATAALHSALFSLDILEDTK